MSASSGDFHDLESPGRVRTRKLDAVGQHILVYSMLVSAPPPQGSTYTYSHIYCFPQNQNHYIAHWSEVWHGMVSPTFPLS